MLARASVGEELVEQAVCMPSTRLDVSCGTKSVMGVDVPDIKMNIHGSDSLPYAFPSVTAELDLSIARISRLTEKLLRLAEIEIGKMTP